MLSKDLPLFNHDSLWTLDFELVQEQLNPRITTVSPINDQLLVRPLRPSDYDKGFVELLGQLTKNGKPTKEKFLGNFAKMLCCPDTYYVAVIEDQGKIIGAATLFVEYKFHQNCAKRGHLEDVVVNNTYRGEQLENSIVIILTLFARQLGCCQLLLECKDKLIPFYNSLGFSLEPGTATQWSSGFHQLQHMDVE